MKFPCRIMRLPDGKWSVTHESSDLGLVEARASTREEVLEKIRNEIRYRLELCPCTGETYRHVQVEVMEVS